MPAEILPPAQSNQETFGPRHKSAEQLIEQQKRVTKKIADRTSKLIANGAIGETNTKDNYLGIERGMMPGVDHVIHDRKAKNGKTIKTTITPAIGRMAKEVYDPSTDNFGWVESGSGRESRLKSGSARAVVGSNEGVGQVMSHDRERFLFPDETVSVAAKIAKEQWRELDRREEQAQPKASEKAKDILDA